MQSSEHVRRRGSRFAPVVALVVAILAATSDALVYAKMEGVSTRARTMGGAGGVPPPPSEQIVPPPPPPGG
jgi:hypothetical protein